MNWPISQPNAKCRLTLKNDFILRIYVYPCRGQRVKHSAVINMQIVCLPCWPRKGGFHSITIDIKWPGPTFFRLFPSPAKKRMVKKSIRRAKQRFKRCINRIHIRAWISNYGELKAYTKHKQNPRLSDRKKGSAQEMSLFILRPPHMSCNRLKLQLAAWSWLSCLCWALGL